MAEKVYIVELRKNGSDKIVIQKFFNNRQAAESCCYDLQHFEKYGFTLFIGMEKF